MRGLCSAEQKQSCPLVQCLGSDTHHDRYPAHDYKTKIEKTYRDQPFNKAQLPRCVHQAIHASGYIPEKPSRDTMLQEVWDNGSERAAEELERQIAIGKAVLDGTWPETAA